MLRDYYLFSNGQLRRRHNTLVLERASDERSPGAEAEDDGAPSGEPTGEKTTIPVEAVDQLYAFGEITVNAKLVTFLAQHRIPLHFFDYYGHYTATLQPRAYLLSGRLRVEQARHYLSHTRRLVLARTFVDAAMFNIGRVLGYFGGRADGEAAAAICRATEGVEAETARAAQAPGVPELMAAEGRARHAYYQAWPAILGRQSARFPFTARERRPPSNEMNALISFGNALCYTLCLKQLYRTALDPTIAFLHEPGERRFSLALDLAEVFKPLLVDRMIFRLVKTGRVQPDHFEQRLGGTFLTETGRRRVVEAWDERLRRTVRHRGLGRPVSYARLVRLDAYALSRHLLAPKADPYGGFRAWW